VLDRGFSFADPRVRTLLAERYVPVALDGHAHGRRRDAEGRLFRHVVRQRPGPRLGASRQGLYICAPDGTLLDAYNNRIVRDLVVRLEEAAAIPGGARDSAGAPPPDAAEPEPPAGAVVAKLFKHALLPVPADTPPRAAHLLGATGLDNLWLLADELAALRQGRVERRLARRIARFALVDNTRGEAAPWRRSEVRRLELAAECRRGRVRLRGEARLAGVDGCRAYSAALLGRARWRGTDLHRFDLVARGSWRGGSPYVSVTPPGTFPLAVVATLAGVGPPASVPPHGMRRPKSYLAP